MSTKTTKKTTDYPSAQTPLLLRCHRLMDAFAKSDDERDFYLDRVEGFLVYVDLDRPTEELDVLYNELAENVARYCIIPKLTFFETKKIMEGFVNEKVYDIDTKEKLLDIIQSKEAREHFLEFIYDHHTELEKWQQFYQERSRIRIIEWLRKNEFYFVFEEDLDFNKTTMENVKKTLFDKEVGRDVQTARKALVSKAKTYYSNEALNPRPKRGRPPKQTAKLEVEPQVTVDLFTQVPAVVRPFLFTPDISSSSAVTFSSKFDSEAELLASRRINQDVDYDLTLENLNKKLASLRELSGKLLDKGTNPPVNGIDPLKKAAGDVDDDEEYEEEDEDTEIDYDEEDDFDDSDDYSDEEEHEEETEDEVPIPPQKTSAAKGSTEPPVKKAPASNAKAKSKVAAAPKPVVKKAPAPASKVKPAAKKVSGVTSKAKPAPAKKAPGKKAPPKKAAAPVKKKNDR